jgi:uncharacterized protein (TIGR02246 family)
MSVRIRSRQSGFAMIAAMAVLSAVSALILWHLSMAQAENRAPDSAAITAALNAQVAAWNRGDVDAFLEGYWRSPEVSFGGATGFTKGWDSVRDHYKMSYTDRAAMGTLDFSRLEFRFLGPDAALVLGYWHLKREKGDVGGVFSLVWQRFPEGWRIVHDHTSQVP